MRNKSILYLRLLGLTCLYVLSPQDCIGKHSVQSAHEPVHSGWQRNHHRQPLICSPWGNCSGSWFQQTPRRVLQRCTSQLPACSCGNSSSNSHRPTAKSPSACQLPDDCESGPQCSQDRYIYWEENQYWMLPCCMKGQKSFKYLILFCTTFAAACHSQDRPTAAVTPIQSATPVTYLPHLAVCPQPSSSPAQGCTRAGVAMGCAAASLTPPNVSAASLEGDALRPVPILSVPVGPVNSSALNPASNSAALACRLDKDVKVGCVYIFSWA